MDQFDFLSLSPLHVEEHASRLNSILRLKDNIAGTIKTVQQYADAGGQLCHCMGRLAESFTCYNEFQSDPTLRTISDLLVSFQSVFNEHYTQVLEHIVTPLKRFMKEDICIAEEAGKRAEHDIDTYIKMLDTYTMLNKKKAREFDQEERDVRLMAAHWQAVNSDFAFERQLSLVERKKLIDVTAIFLMFVNLASVSYKQCYVESEDAKDSFLQLQQSLPESTKAVSNYVSQTTLLNKSLFAAHGLYWKRLKLEFPGTGALEHEGYLWKKGSGFTKSWQRRYFLCRGNELAYFHNADDSDTPQGKLPLLLTSVKPLMDPERRFCFTIISQKKVYTLQALTEWDMNEWMNVIKNNIQYLLDHSGPDAAVATHVSDADSGHPQQVPANQQCADCGAACPTWCCINWGNCICIRCSGVHRELTTSVSKVRSLTLDRMEPTVLSLMSLIGNERANQVLEANLTDARISEHCEREVRDAFLRRKYQECEFVDDSEKVDLRAAVQAGDIMKVYKGLCQMKKLKETDDDLLKVAAACGDPAICFLVGLNSETINSLDSGGWSALSYAAYYGHSAAAEALIALGCDPSAAPKAHPYAIAYTGLNQSLATMFLPYWHGEERPRGEYTPPIRVTGISPVASDAKGSHTLSLIGQVSALG